MGASNSSGRIPGRSISLEPMVKKKPKKNGERNKRFRNSMNRPVLQLQVKPTTLERVRRRVGSASSGSFPRSTYAAAAVGAESSAYDNLDPRARTLSNSSRSSDHAHHKRTLSTISRDSMMLLQIVEGDHGDAVVTARGGAEDNYDHLTSNKDFSRLCECTYGRVDVQMEDSGQGAWSDGREAWLGCEGDATERHNERAEVKGGGDTHTADVIYCQGQQGCSQHGLRPSQLILRPPSLVVNVDEVRRRIQYHQRVPSNESPSPRPPADGSLLSFNREVGGAYGLSGSSMRKSKSTSELLNHQVAMGDGHTHDTRRGLTASQSSMEGWAHEEGDEDGGMCEWTLGESIMRALSKRDLLVIDIDNPQTQSEVEIMEAWPRLKAELKRCGMSQSTGNITIATISH